MNVCFRAGLCLSPLITSAVAAPQKPGADPGTGPQGYVLFMGADLAIEHGKQYYHVDNVEGSNFVINVGGKREFIPTQKGTSRMRIDNALKLAGSPVNFDKLETERDYTPARDPRRKFNRMAGMAGAASAASDVASMDYRLGQTAVAYASIDPYAPPSAIEAAQAFQDQSTANQNAAFAAESSEINSNGYHAQQLQVELSEENYDAIRISLDVSSPTPLNDPYLLVIARIHERDEKPGVFRNWIFAQKIDPVGPKPQKIRINQGGLPVGYGLDDVQVRIYNRGHEVPTNNSPKRVELTRDQAQQYVLIEHLAANKGVTMPALPVICRTPAGLKEHLAAGEYSQPYFIKVDAGGNPQGTFTNKECTKATDDPFVLAVVAEALFTPALEQGRPVNGVARLQLAALLN